MLSLVRPIAYVESHIVYNICSAKEHSIYLQSRKKPLKLTFEDRLKNIVSKLQKATKTLKKVIMTKIFEVDIFCNYQLCLGRSF